MIITKFLELVDYKITGGSLYCWRCFGDNVWSFECLLYKYHPDESIDVVFDTVTLEVYSIQVGNWCWYHPDYFEAYKQEALDRNVDYTVAWDDTEFEFVTFDEIIVRAENLVKDNE